MPYKLSAIAALVIGGGVIRSSLMVPLPWFARRRSRGWEYSARYSVLSVELRFAADSGQLRWRCRKANVRSARML